MTVPLFEAAAELQGVCERHAWRFCIIGGMAVLRWGDPRTTRDVDITVMAGFGGEREVAERLLEHFVPRVDDPVAFASRNRVLLLAASNGTPLDVALGALPFEERVMERSSTYDFGGFVGRTCSAEDLVVMKAFAGRFQDWADVENILAAQGSRLDGLLVLQELEPLVALADVPENLARMRALLHSAG